MAGRCLLFVVFLTALGSRFFGIYTESYAWTLSSTLVAGSAPAWLLVVLLGCVFCVTGILVRNFVRSSGERLEELGLGMMRRGRLALIFLVNGLAMLLLDGAYIYVVMTSNAGVTLAMEIATAVLKLMWNEVVLWYFIPLSTKVIELSKTRTSSTLSISSHDNRLPSLHSIHSSIQRTIRSHQYDEYEVRALGLIVTANSIIIPAIAIACLSSSCYYRALFAAEPVTATTFIPDCALYLSSPNGQKCANFVLTTTDTTYDPPFFYDYECSSTIVNSYCAVFVFTCLSMMASCAMDLLGHYLHCTLPVEHRWRWVLKWWSTRVRIPLNANCTPPSGTHLLGLNSLVLRFCSLLCIALTCGLVFPPLALIVFITVVCITYSEQFFAGRLIEAAERLQLQGVLDDISLEIKPMFRLFFAAARPSFLISLLCVAMILFDIAGASSGWVMGLAAALSFIALFFVSNMAEIVWTNRDAYSPSLWLKRFSFDAKDVELDSEMELAKNPIHRSRADPDTPCS